MFTILNILNYFSGKPLNVFVLITITVLVYYLLINKYSDTIYNSTTYTIILLILLILDIVSIILIYFYDRKIDDKELNQNNVESESETKNEIKLVTMEKKSKKDKSKKNKNKDKLNDLNEKKVINGLPDNKEKSYPLDSANKDIISLYDVNKDPSLVTY